MRSSATHLTAAGVSVVVTAEPGALPVIAYWGAALGPVDDAALERIATDSRPVRAVSEPDVPLSIGVLPEAKQGWMGFPGIAGHRAGRGSFADVQHVVSEHTPAETPDAAERVTARGVDVSGRLSVALEIELLPSGVLRTRAAVRNDGEDDYSLAGLDLALPIPGRATELLDFSGRHNGERRPQRSTLVDGTHLRENRRGRTGPDAATLLVAGTPGFDFGRGEVWAIHNAWSGNQRVWAERTNGGRGFLGAGELLHAGEITLRPGQEYSSPWIYASHGDGLDAASARIHSTLRARPSHPPIGRPVTLNTWEAVYFDHSLPPLLELADLAERVGVERFVLDDGWFLGRRHDRAGLGDWLVDESVWPDGLAPLVDHVRGLGMQFGIWFEPEMVNPDSELARAHPDWILSPVHRDAPLARQQLVLNTAHPDAYASLRDRIVGLVTEHRIDYIKWDHNRDLLEPVDRSTGVAGVHAQTLASYRLIDEIRAACPWLEIESCSAGGGRIDLGIVERVDRFWTSDSNDPLERQRIQRWTSLLMPPELLGSHVGAARAHVTGRHSSLTFRAVTALVGSFGVEWDLREASAAELAELTAWIGQVKRLAPLIERGTLHRLETEHAHVAQSIVSDDAGHAIVTLAAIDSPPHIPGPALRLAGLDPERLYRVARVRVEGADDPTSTRAQPAWWNEEIGCPGSVLMWIGLPMPALRPQEAALIEVIGQ
ncbi:alpha-galactosidase [Microterricola gilva]|uniref:Alpha-galactosidase n=1 Tax=Microterricola gilva TaxID=393267 RepID=A0A4Q8APM2_9MICO|nr:alpha-galactosidase [Microterricola gilva]RZU66640.1 alpha-galactosidase [Microterricola gilva]